MVDDDAADDTDPSAGPPRWPRARLFRSAVIDCLAAPGLGLFAGMVGFGALCRASGLDWAVTLASPLTVWGLPGQVAMVELYAAGAGLFGVFFAVALANARMMAMTLSALPMIRPGRHGFSALNVLIAHLLAITSWAHMTRMDDRLHPDDKVPYFLVFAGSVYALGPAGAATGYFASDLLPREVVLALLFLSPVYITVLILGARRAMSLVAILFGWLLVPPLSLLLPDWGLLIGGFAGGTAAWLIMRPKPKAGGNGG